MSTSGQDRNRKSTQGGSARPPQQGGSRPAARSGQPARPAASRISQPVTNTKAGPVRVSGARPPQSPGVNPMIVVVGVAGMLLILLGVLILPNLMNNNSATTTPTTGAAAGGGSAAGGLSTVVVQTDKGIFKIRLFTDDPSVGGTVKNFQDKVASGFFDGKTFHRVEGWVVQGGDPLGNGTGGGDIPGEYNSRSFTRGAIGMASTAGGGPIVNDSQWFVVKSDAPHLDTQYTNFAQVIEGMEVVDQIAIGDKMIKLTLEN